MLLQAALVRGWLPIQAGHPADQPQAQAWASGGSCLSGVQRTSRVHGPQSVMDLSAGEGAAKGSSLKLKCHPGLQPTTPGFCRFQN